MQTRPTHIRVIRYTLAFLAVVLAGACDGLKPSHREVTPRVELLEAEAYSQHLAARAPADLSDSEVIALGYLERVRLGLSSPFRLMAYALRDPELPQGERELVALAMLAEVLRGRTYEIHPSVLNLVSMKGVAPQVSTAAHQLALIERTMAAAPSEDSGERIIRLGYQLATAERTVDAVRQSVVAHVAALVSDRFRARADARALVRTAASAGVSPLALIPATRARRGFEVEAPAMTALSVREEETVATQGPRLALALRALAQRLGSPATLVDAGPAEASTAPGSFLQPETAARLLEISERRGYPPQAPVAVAVLINRGAMLAPELATGGEDDRREHFADAAWNEERLVAAARMQSDAPAVRLRLALIELQAAVFLRAWNQEEPWFPGDPAPAVKDLVGRFNLAAVEFGPELPEAWRPYYVRMLWGGLLDLQRVLPTASVRGLTIRIAELPANRQALALHDPRRRTLHLPPHTGAGTLAHELAHDLDWQLARTRYSSRGGYATDLAVSGRRGDRIEYALKGLESSLTQPRIGSDSHDMRPTEVFARGTDWFVAAVMAREGRVGGYLTSFQDPVLTGYGTTRGPDVGGGAVASLLNLLDAVAPVGRGTREWAMDTYGPHRMLTPAEISGAVVGAGRNTDPFRRLREIEAVRDRSRAVVDNAACRLSSAEGLRRLSTAQRNLVQATAAAAARGVVVDATRKVAGELGADERMADSWVAWRLYGAPEPTDSVLHSLEPYLEEVLYHARALEQDDPVPLAGALGRPFAAPLCGGNPFASVAVQRELRGPATGFTRGW